MFESVDESNPQYNIVFSYQGAFGPPTYGHYKSMEAFANKVLQDYPDSNILMLFMPTAGGSKAHLLPTRQTRVQVLNKFCQMLKSRPQFSGANIRFEPSEIEYGIFDSEGTKGKTATIYTIDALRHEYPGATICLGMGSDNAYQLPYWERINEYADKVAKIYAVQREATIEELDKTALFTISTESGFEPVQLRFDVTVPWTNTTFKQVFLIADKQTEDIQKGNKTALIASLNRSNIDQNTYEIHMNLPEIVMIKTKIPATSSTMMRYYIGQVISNINVEENKEKIRKLMFGDCYDDESLNHTIENYRFIFPSIIAIPVYADYDSQYESLHHFTFQTPTVLLR